MNLMFHWCSFEYKDYDFFHYSLVGILALPIRIVTLFV